MSNPNNWLKYLLRLDGFWGEKKWYHWLTVILNAWLELFFEERDKITQ